MWGSNARLRFVLSCLAIGLVAGVVAVEARDKSLRKPLTAYFEGYAKLIIDDEFIGPTGAYIDTHYSGDGLANLSRLDNFSALLIGNRAGRLLTAEENAALEKWVAGGGTLIFSADEPRRLWDNKLPEWVGGNGACSHWSSTPFVAKIQQPDHPLLRGLVDLVPKEGWKKETGFGFTAGQSLIGADKVSLLYENRHGKGRVIYAGANLIPSQWPSFQSPPAVLDGILLRNLTPVMQQFLKNLVVYLGLPTRHEVIAAWAKSRSSSEAFAVWFKEEEKPIGGRAHIPPFPATKADELKKMRFDMGIGEVAQRDFFITTLREIPNLIVEITDLKGPKGSVIPSANMRVSIQEPPGTNYWKASYWVLDPRDVVPLGSSAVKTRADETYTYWIELPTGEVPSGDYKGALRFRDGDKLLRSLPVQVKVWPLHAPSADVLHFEMEHIWFCMPGGYWIDPKENNPALLAKYQKNLGKLGVDVGETWSDIDKGYYNRFIRLRADGRPLDQALAESPELFLKDPMPSLSFLGGPHDAWWNNAIQAGMSSFSQTWQLGDVSHGMAVTVLKNDKLAIGSPEHLRFVKWFWGEYLKSLRERGLFEAYIKVGDEFGPEAIPDYLKAAVPMHEAGFKVYTTTYNAMATKAAVEQMDPATDMWQIAFSLDNPRDLFRANNIPFDPNNEIWGTCASSFWGSWYGGGRGFGLLAARLHMDGIHLHGYMRWQRNEGQGCWHAPHGPGASAGNTVWGNSISDGRYLAQLYRLIAWAKKSGRGAEVAQEIEREISEQIIGLPRPGHPAPLIPLKAGDEHVMGGIKTRYAVFAMPVTAADCNAAKLKIFEMMLRLQKAMGSPAPSVVYDTIPLVTDGKVVCQIVASADDATAVRLAERIRQLGGVKPAIVRSTDFSRNPLSARRAEPTKVGTTNMTGTLVFVGTLQNNPALAAFVAKECPSEVTPHYPVTGMYAIVRLPSALVMVGGDQVGLEIGVNNLCRLLTTEHRW